MASTISAKWLFVILAESLMYESMQLEYLSEQPTIFFFSWFDQNSTVTLKRDWTACPVSKHARVNSLQASPSPTPSPIHFRLAEEVSSFEKLSISSRCQWWRPLCDARGTARDVWRVKIQMKKWAWFSSLPRNEGSVFVIMFNPVLHFSVCTMLPYPRNWFSKHSFVRVGARALVFILPKVIHSWSIWVLTQRVSIKPSNIDLACTRKAILVWSGDGHGFMV